MLCSWMSIVHFDHSHSIAISYSPSLPTDTLLPSQCLCFLTAILFHISQLFVPGN